MQVLLADDHALFRDGLRIQIESIDTKAEIFEASNYNEVISLISSKPNIDVMLLDLDMPGMQWREALPKISGLTKESKVIIISASDSQEDVTEALRCGVSGYIPKNLATKILVGAIKLVLEGGTYLPPSMINHVSTHSKPEKYGIYSEKENEKGLTSRQKEVLLFLGEGLSNKQIAYKMQVSEATVKLHINALLRNLNVTNRTQAVIVAQKKGII